MDYRGMLTLLKSSIKEDNKFKAEKCIRIERWFRTYNQFLKYFNEEQLKFFSDIFSDDSCWEEARLKNKIVGKKLAKPENGNPLDLSERYRLACIYCLENDIPQMFKQLLERFKKSVSRTSSDGELKNRFLKSLERDGPIITYWSKLADEQSDVLKELNSINGFHEAKRINWEEGLEYFWEKLNIPIKEKENLLMEAALFAARGRKNAGIIEFCLARISDEQKVELLQRDREKGQDDDQYAVLSTLLQELYFDFFKDLFTLLEPNDIPCEEYRIFLFGLINKMDNYPELAKKGERCFVDIWDREGFRDHKLSVLNDSFIDNQLEDLIRAKGVEAFWKVVEFADNVANKVGDFIPVAKAINICFSLYSEDQSQDLLKRFLKHYITNEEDIARFARKFRQFQPNEPEIQELVRQFEDLVNKALSSSESTGVSSSSGSSGSKPFDSPQSRLAGVAYSTEPLKQSK